uniref:SIS domain-containing protein n=1 Tax=Plectus sambesii TaxID=2011161 RepID=A0A914X6Q8_9BILA
MTPIDQQKHAQDEGVDERFLDAAPSAESIDYVTSATQFQLHTLLTEQRHPKTLQLSKTAVANADQALQQLFFVDEDILRKIKEVANEPAHLVQAAKAIQTAIADGRKIFFYGCGATGRLCKVLECAVWRPFWRKVKRNDAIWASIKSALKKPDDIEEQVIGEITGGDRALVSSLEGFEDLQIIGRRQMESYGIRKGDVVFSVTEGGETSSVIGVILAAREQCKDEEPEMSKEHLYFVYNNPDEVLLPFDRSRTVLENDAITKINLCTGPQGITGSTRMQATSISLFVLGVVLEHALQSLLSGCLQADQLSELGFTDQPSLSDRLLSFHALLETANNCRQRFSKLTELESSIYAAGHHSTYFAVGPPLMAVFTDVTERSPTFSLFPLDTTHMTERKSWIHVCTAADEQKAAWEELLGRPFHGLEPASFSSDFEHITNCYLKEAAIKSLANAGREQEEFYDFSLNSVKCEEGDLVVVILSDCHPMPAKALENLISKAVENKARIAVIELHAPANQAKKTPNSSDALFESAGLHSDALRLQIEVDTAGADPLGIREQIALKMLLNAHSTTVMTRLGRVVGNTMTNVKPSNLKLIGRATYLIQLHVNQAMERANFQPPISYAETNAVLYEAIAWKRSHPSQRHSEVELAIVKILETAAKIQKKAAMATTTWAEAFAILEKKTLEEYLKSAL